ncbi:MAG TPA: acyl-CoA dehydrogenase family protein [Steroidobacteraceae bacterium]|nr:acyl-CoA dehydrogenase family protein [Steroidobacteraceae bacterium]
MNFSFTTEQSLIRETARQFFDEHGVSSKIRAAIARRPGYDESLWRLLAQEMGWAGIALAEEYGGSGLGWVELAILQYEQGRRVFPSPFFATVCLASPLIEAVGEGAQKRELLGRIAAGTLRAAVAVTGREGIAGLDGVRATLERARGQWQLCGECGYVVDGASAELLLVIARTPGSRGAQGLSVVVLPPARSGVTIEGLATLDLTRPMAAIRLDRVPVAAGEMLGPPEAAGEGVLRALERARVALAAEAAGGAEAVLEMSVAHAKERVQFGRPIGSFQAVKHRLADMMVAVEAAKSAAWYAACVADECPEDLPEASAIAKAACCDAYLGGAGSAIQLHGGIGFTWEHDAHLYFKRARSTATLLGTPCWQREVLAAAIGLGSGTAPAF